MLEMRENDSSLEVNYRCFYLPITLLVIPPAMIYQHSPSLLDNSISAGELIGLGIGIVLPLAICAYFVEFARFEFAKADGMFRWHWRNFFRRRSGEIPLQRVVKVGRDELDASDLVGMQSSYRLLVLLDDGESIALTRSFSGFDDRKLDKMVDAIRDYLGHVTPMD